RQVRTTSQRVVPRRPCPAAPVLAVPSRDDQGMGAELCGPTIDVHVGRVREVIALSLEEAHERQLAHVTDRNRDGVAVWAVKRNLHAGGDTPVVRWIEALAAPRVVGLPRVDRDLDEAASAIPWRGSDDQRGTSDC